MLAPVLASFKPTDDGGVELWITNDRLTALNDSLTVRLGTFDGITVWEERIAVQAAGQTSMVVARWDAGRLAPSANRYLAVRSGDQQFPTNRHFFAPIKDLQRAPVRPDVRTTQIDRHRLRIELTAPPNSYVFFANLFVPREGTRYSDNFLDLEPAERRVIEISNAFAELEPTMVGIGWR